MSDRARPPSPAHLAGRKGRSHPPSLLKLAERTVEMIRDALSFLAAMAGTILPHRYWSRLPVSFPLRSAAFASALVTFFFGASIGIPGFLEHIGYVASATNAATIKLAEQQNAAGMHPDDPRAAKVLPGVHILGLGLT